MRIEWQAAPQSKVRTEPKTRRSRRTVPLPEVVSTALREHSEQFPPADDGTIFTTRFTGPYRHDYYGSLIFSAAVKRAGLPEGTTSHDLRHHCASVLLMQGESVTVVAERLGHENASLVLSTHGHLMPDSEKAPAARLTTRGVVPPVCPERQSNRLSLRKQAGFRR
ncbi:tyrosine-type recombinase/integrase [Salinispora pacifica]|uniref:tyrosine-type recombinase/integrase n=1 Tax=Salinispora pacifica TaxID=351187 RepID=UPI0003A9F34B|nr:tyrosine-type recombinase/integrase [Salinispora pacifica]